MFIVDIIVVNCIVIGLDCVSLDFFFMVFRLVLVVVDGMLKIIEVLFNCDCFLGIVIVKLK